MKSQYYIAFKFLIKVWTQLFDAHRAREGDLVSQKTYQSGSGFERPYVLDIPIFEVLRWGLSGYNDRIQSKKLYLGRSVAPLDKRDAVHHIMGP